MPTISPYDVLATKPPPLALALLPDVGGQLTLDGGWQTKVQALAYANTVNVQAQDFSPLGNQVSLSLKATFNQDAGNVVSALARYVLFFFDGVPPVPLGLARLPQELEFGAVGAALTLSLVIVATKTKFGG